MAASTSAVSVVFFFSAGVLFARAAPLPQPHAQLIALQRGNGAAPRAEFRNSATLAAKSGPASPPCAKNQGRRALQPLPLKNAAARAVFGQIKQARGFRQFLLRGVEKVANEWGLVCLAHNILKLAQGRTPSLAALATG